MRKKKMIFNTATSLTNQIVTMISGFILPKLFLEYYGSTTNGLISSITQFLGFIAFLELGVGSVVQSALYRPLAEGDNEQVSKIIKSANNFFKKIAFILVIYTIILVLFYPRVTVDKFSYVYTATMILIIAISYFAQYYLGIKYQLLLNADQKSYIQLIIQIFTVVINTISIVFLIRMNVSIHIVKLTTSLIFIIKPILLSIYVNKKYSINKNIFFEEEPIKQKWSGLAQHIASVVLANTDIVILTLFSSLENVSIYTVYNLVVSGVKQIITSVNVGMSALFGNMLAKNEKKQLINTFEKYEILIHFLVTVCFTCTGILIIPFVRVYTNGINDANYIIPLFGMVITMAQAAYCLRLPYNVIVLAAGHYKQTQKSAIIEMLLNIIISLLVVIKFGLIGVAIGTLIAMGYRTCYLANYLRRNIIHRKLKYFLKNLLVDLVIVILTILVYFNTNINIDINSYIQFIVLSIKILTITLINGIAVNLLFNNRLIREFSNDIKIRKLKKTLSI